MKAEGQENIINLLRCAWAGSQKYGALVWSGDIKSSFPSMKNQVAAGLNMGIAGIPWWTTDIGGFFGANINDPEFHELLVRWFEYGCFCPVMRLHGYRWPLQPQYGTTGGATCVSGAPNEVWSYTDQVCEILSDYLRLRERMLPYITELMEEAHEKGTPVMRPLFYDFPEDKESWNVRKQRTAEGHAVRANYMYSAMADLAYEYQDKELQQACRNLWDNMVHKRMYITGSVGSSGFLERFTTDYDLPNDSNYSETCATIALAMFGKRMADMEKDASYMDVVERALYNTLLSGIAMDGKSFFYVNPLEVWPVSCMPRTSREHVKPVRQKWFGVACCPPNITRTLASLGQYIYFQEENEIYVNLYVANETEVTLNGVPFKITLKGNFPWENKMTVSVDGVQETEAMIAFRVPAYAENFKILRNGKEENLTEDHGYIKISGKMYKETFEVSFDAEPVFVHANPQVRVDSAKVAVVKGPLVYCVEEADNGENLSSVMVNTDQKIEETYDDELLEGCSVLHITGKKISEKGWNEGILYQNRKVELEDVKLTLVPYCYWGNRENGEMLVWMKELFYM